MKTPSFRQLRRMLTAHDSRFEFYTRKGKGSHRTIAHPDIHGEEVSLILPVHGEGADVQTPYLRKL